MPDMWDDWTGLDYKVIYVREENIITVTHYLDFLTILTYITCNFISYVEICLFYSYILSKVEENTRN